MPHALLLVTHSAEFTQSTSSTSGQAGRTKDQLEFERLLPLTLLVLTVRKNKQY